LTRALGFDGEEFKSRRVGRSGVLMEPVVDAERWFAELDALSDEPMWNEGRSQPETPAREVFD
jgi:antitoxin VapB